MLFRLICNFVEFMYKNGIKAKNIHNNLFYIQIIGEYVGVEFYPPIIQDFVGIFVQKKINGVLNRLMVSCELMINYRVIKIKFIKFIFLFEIVPIQ